ncbi:MAG: hypothetical protein ABI822_05740, partial [Bryobacteraceae bacterium]
HPLPALAGTLFFLYHPATFDAYWQPMYVFDLLCGAFCLASLLAFVDRRWIVSFLCFVCAYKAKEVAVMLPAVLASYELILGERRWKPLVPFFAVSLLFGIQALISNANTNDAYTLRVTAASLLQSSRFYAWRVVVLSAAAFALLARLRDARGWFGLSAALLFLIPLLAIPSRTFSVYSYVPLIGAAVALGASFDRTKAWAALVFLGLWLPITFVQMREYRRSALTIADENRAYVSGLSEFLGTSPQTNAFLEDGAPAAMHPWGVRGAILYLSKKPEIQLASINDPEASNLLSQPHLAVLSWDQVTRKLQITHREPDTPEESYISMRRGMPIWQFGDGWYQRENFYRWTKPNAHATLRRPEGAGKFEVLVNISPVHILDVTKAQLEVLLDGESLGTRDFTVSGWQKRIYAVKPGPAALVKVEFRVTPAYHPRGDPRVLGIPVGGFGFPAGQ